MKTKNISFLVDGMLSEWSTYGDCSETCGDGIHSRIRVCTEPLHGGKPCDGDLEEQQTCKVVECPG